MQERSEAELRAIWPCLNVATLQAIRLDRRHQSAFLKKRFCIHNVPPARAADKKIQPT